MIRFASHLAAAAAVSLILAGAATAQTPSTATPTPAAKSAPADTKADSKAEKPRTAASLECSKQADAKSLHGDARRKFRSECKKTSKAN
jgi:hypothetical protein